jgi:two-component system chemotaxis response regulator CheY
MLALIVDDSAAIRRIQQKELEALGWQVRTAAHGQQALEMLCSIPACDLLLTDWHMPEMDGLELVRRVRRDMRFSTLRIIVVSSDAVMDSVHSALAAGADDFLMKPFSAEALSQRIDEVMGG